ncbi:MAG: hypothetical protein SGJ04_01080 [Bacteroidota bacterium]|nr:hypothetical protein [Bacteroidota bacterium]
MTNSDTHVEIVKIQKQIKEIIGLKAENLIFDFRSDSGKEYLDLITVNPKHRQSFLYHTTIGTDKLDALFKMLEYVESHSQAENSYTIQWMHKEENELHTSYFRGGNVYEALDKLYFGRDITAITVYFVKLNPIS